MGILNTLRAKFLGIDPAYDNVRASQLPRYQHYFERLLAAVDLETQTNWGMNRPYDKQQFRRDEEVMERIIVGEAVPEGLHPAVLQVMVNQYFLADVWHRERDREQWAHRVLHRQKVDYFPSASAVIELLQRVS